MLTSSSEYLHALRQGQYLLFLEWPHFVAERYKADDAEQDADELINLLVFEWLNNGYSEEDGKLIALLSTEESRPREGVLGYAFVSISIALLQCMVYASNNVHHHYLKDKKNKKEIKQLMEDNSCYLEQSVFVTSLQKQETTFLIWVDKIQKGSLKVTYESIMVIAKLRCCLAKYVLDLNSMDLPDDKLKSSRLSIVEQLERELDLSNQLALTVKAQNKLDTYVTKLRNMGPTVAEKTLLNALIAPSIAENVWSIVTGIIAPRLFKLLEPPDEPASDIEKKASP
jgi:hypothetical protein